MNTHSLKKHWNEISLYRSRILPTPFIHVANVSTYVKTFREVDCANVILFDISTATYPDPTDALKSYDEIEGTTLLFVLPMLKENAIVFISFFMAFVFSFKTIFIFCPTLTFRFSLFIVNSTVTFSVCRYYSIFTNIGCISYYNILMILTNFLPDVPFLTVRLLHPTENSMQCPFQQAGVLFFFGFWWFCLITKCSYVLHNFRHYFHAKAFKLLHTALFNKFRLFLLKSLVKVKAVSLKYLLRFLSNFLIISFFLMCVYYV